MPESAGMPRLRRRVRLVASPEPHQFNGGAAHLFDPHLEPVEPELFAGLRDASETAQDQRAQLSFMTARRKRFSAVKLLRQARQANRSGGKPFAVARLRQ